MSKKKKDSLYYELERISHKDLTTYHKRSEEISDYFRENYNYFAQQRKNIFDVLQDSIRRNTIELKFNHYQRAASYKYCLTPLSAKGRLVQNSFCKFQIG